MTKLASRKFLIQSPVWALSTGSTVQLLDHQRLSECGIAYVSGNVVERGSCHLHLDLLYSTIGVCLLYLLFFSRVCYKLRV